MLILTVSKLQAYSLPPRVTYTITYLYLYLCSCLLSVGQRRAPDPRIAENGKGKSDGEKRNGKERTCPELVDIEAAFSWPAYLVAI